MRVGMYGGRWVGGEERSFLYATALSVTQSEHRLIDSGNLCTRSFCSQAAIAFLPLPRPPEFPFFFGLPLPL